MDEARARDVLAAAGVLPGPAAGARLLALGENAVFAAGDLVVKVGRDAELLGRARRELDIAAWLAAAGVPAVRAAEPEALMAEGHPGDRVAPAARRRPAGRARGICAELLRLVHALPVAVLRPAAARPAGRGGALAAARG